MKILVITPGNLPVPAINGGGVETLIDLYLHNNEDNQFVVYSVGKELDIDTSGYHNVEFRFLMRKKHKLSFIKDVFIDLVRRRDYKSFDFVIIENMSNYAVILRPLFKNRIILHLHNDYLNITTRYKYLKYRCCDEIWCVSKFIKTRVDQLAKKTPLKTKVFYNAINDIYFEKKLNNIESVAIRNKYNIPKDEIVFMYSGRLFDGKGVNELAQAFMDANVSNASLLIVGGNKNNYDEKDSYIKTLINNTKKCDKIHILGMKSIDELIELYSISNCLVLPSKVEEAFGLVVVESMATGTPVIATKKGGIPEIVNNNNGIIIENKDLVIGIKEAISSFLNSEKQYNSGCIETAKRFTSFEYNKRFNKLINSFYKRLKYNIIVFSEYPKSELNAGPKAKTDVENILFDEYSCKVVSQNYRTGLNRFQSFIYKAKKLLLLFLYGNKKRTVIIQFPYMLKGYQLLRKYKNSICFIHDIDGLRRQDDVLLNKEINFLNSCSAVVVHNKCMKDKLVSCGLNTKIYILELFDYIMNDSAFQNKEYNQKGKNIKLVYAGNLAKEKSPFLYDIEDYVSANSITVNVYGVGITKDISESILYNGSFSPDVLPHYLDGDFGLIWDGKSTEDDENLSFKAYTKYNNPHKLSCYLAAGLPVIAWNKAAIASFIQENDIGYIINNLRDINQLDLSNYNRKKENVLLIQKKIIDGYYTKQVIKNILNDFN